MTVTQATVSHAPARAVRAGQPGAPRVEESAAIASRGESGSTQNPATLSNDSQRPHRHGTTGPVRPITRSLPQKVSESAATDSSTGS